MNPMAPVSMLTGGGNEKALLVVALLVGLVICTHLQQSTPLTK